jgi:hypothetical protein
VLQLGVGGAGTVTEKEILAVPTVPVVVKVPDTLYVPGARPIDPEKLFPVLGKNALETTVLLPVLPPKS